jgi:endonuclease/exonuclease/phosphatase family metal-dependent hydrolase
MDPIQPPAGTGPGSRPGAPADGRPPPAAAPAIRRFATYNLHLGAARAATAQLLADWQPDVLCLQEARDPARLPLPDTAPRPVAVWQPVPGGRWGSGLLLRAAAVPLPLPADLLGWVAGAAISPWGGPGTPPLCAFSIHAPPGQERSYTRMVGRILDVVAEYAGGAEVVLGGDFNVVVGWRQPGEPVRMTRAEQALLERIERDLGLVACWQAAHPGQPLARTLRWRHRADSLPYHCDGLFVPVGWLPALRDCSILTGDPWDGASDHHPVVATFDWRGVGPPGP